MSPDRAVATGAYEEREGLEPAAGFYPCAGRWLACAAERAASSA